MAQQYIRIQVSLYHSHLTFGYSAMLVLLSQSSSRRPQSALLSEENRETSTAIAKMPRKRGLLAGRQGNWRKTNWLFRRSSPELYYLLYFRSCVLLDIARSSFRSSATFCLTQLSVGIATCDTNPDERYCKVRYDGIQMRRCLLKGQDELLDIMT